MYAFYIEIYHILSFFEALCAHLYSEKKKKQISITL